MGMLFNTDATILLLKALNERYNPINLPTYKNGDLRAYTQTTPVLTLYQIWQTFHVNLNTAGPNAEQHFSDLLTHYGTNDNGEGPSTADVIRSHLVEYLGKANCIAIEFFAIPSHQILAHPRLHVPHPSGVNNFSGIVAIETVTYDKAAAFVRFNRTKATRRAPSKTRRPAAKRSRK